MSFYWVSYIWSQSDAQNAEVLRSLMLYWFRAIHIFPIIFLYLTSLSFAILKSLSPIVLYADFFQVFCFLCKPLLHLNQSVVMHYGCCSQCQHKPEWGPLKCGNLSSIFWQPLTYLLFNGHYPAVSSLRPLYLVLSRCNLSLTLNLWGLLLPYRALLPHEATLSGGSWVVCTSSRCSW